MLYVVPIKLSEAKAFVKRWHRHHLPSVASVFNVACCDDKGVIRGVAMVGRPVARGYDDAFTLEITRVATDGARNGCSILYGAARRVAFNLGYRRLVTYTLPEEGGASLRASNWLPDGQTSGGSWDTPTRARTDKAPTCAKSRWVVHNHKSYPGTCSMDLDDEGDRAQVTLFGAP